MKSPAEAGSVRYFARAGGRIAFLLRNVPRDRGNDHQRHADRQQRRHVRRHLDAQMTQPANDTLTLSGVLDQSELDNEPIPEPRILM